jgi:hypothetical protein
VYEGSPLTYRAAVLTSFFQPYNGYSFGDLVTFNERLNAMGSGGLTGFAPDLCVLDPAGALACSTVAAPTDASGLVVGQARLSPGFNRMWFRPDNHDIEELLIKDVYRLEGPANPRLLEP